MKRGLLVLLGLMPAAALGQLEQPRADLENAQFERAIHGFDEAEASGHLDRDSLATLYEGRALARWALGQEELARRDLLCLGALDPERALPPEAPPALRAAFEQSPREPIRITTHVERGQSQVVLRAEVEVDRAALVRSLWWNARRAGGDWLRSEARESTIEAPPSDVVEGWVEAIGPAGALLARAEASAPAETVAPVEPLHPEPIAAAPIPTPPPQSGDTLWVGLAIGGGIALIAAVLAISLAILWPNDATQPSAPVLVGF